MGTDVFALITDWPPMVAAYRAARGLDFYWDAVAAHEVAFRAAQAAGRPVADPPDGLLPYAVERDYPGGFTFVAAGWYCEFLLPRLPAGLGAPLRAFWELVYGEDRPSDLRADARAGGDTAVAYAMRPATARLAHERAGAVPWDALDEAAGDILVPEMAGDPSAPDFGTASTALHRQRIWLAEAAATGRGLVVVISQ